MAKRPQAKPQNSRNIVSRPKRRKLGAVSSIAPAAPLSPRTLSRAEEEPARWTFFTNHSHVLILLAQYRSIVLREVAAHVGITERAVQRIIADLEESGHIEREKIGRQNQYRVLMGRRLRHPVEGHCTIGDLINMIAAAR